VILEYAKKYPNRLLPLVGGPNLGITGNSNRGLKGCKGKYIAFQGGDDVLLPGKISAQVAWMEEDEKRVLCGHQVEIFYEDESSSHIMTPSLPSGVGCKWLIENGVPYGALAIMVRRSRIPDYGFDDRLPTVSDYKLWIDCLDDDGVFGYVPRIYARYRKHSGNVSRDANRCFSDRGETFKLLEKEYPSYLQSIHKGRRNQVGMDRAMILLAESSYLKAITLMMRIYLLSPSLLWKMIMFKLCKISGRGL